tara:strand:+ start:2650 stop:4158 length:1509 start_codon:yes stop_codon:yes gene_type:complete
MFDFFSRKKNKGKTFDPRKQIDNLAELSPASALVYLEKENTEHEELGKAFFLRRDKKLYSEGSNLYLTTPDNLKIAKDQNLNTKRVSLKFFHRRVPHRLNCRVIGRFRILPEIAEALDFHAKAAYKLSPISALKKEDKRQYMRYTLKNYGDSRIPLTTHVTFEAFLRSTNKEFPADGVPPVLLTDMQVNDFAEEDYQGPFTTRDAINQFRDLMLKRQPHERSLQVSKVLKDTSGSMVKKKDVELLLGEINVLGIEMEPLRDVLYLKKSTKAGIRKGEENPYNLHPGEKILTFFDYQSKYYQMLCEVMEVRTQNEVVRPLEFMREESGLKVEFVDYSICGCLIESSPELLKFILGDECPPNVDDEVEFEGEYWEKTFERLKGPMLHFTFYPHIHFPDAVKQFKPELPFKITVVAQIVRTRLSTSQDRTVLQHGLQFAYEPEGIPLEHDELVQWRYSRHIRDNEHLRKVHSQLSQLYGYLENSSLSTNTIRPAVPETPPKEPES